MYHVKDGVEGMAGGANGCASIGGGPITTTWPDQTSPTGALGHCFCWFDIAIGLAAMIISPMNEFYLNFQRVGDNTDVAQLMRNDARKDTVFCASAGCVRTQTVRENLKSRT